MKTNETYLDLKTLSSRTCLSVRTLREYLKDQFQPLPYYKLAGKNLVKWSEFERWIERYRVNENIDVDQIIEDVCQ